MMFLYPAAAMVFYIFLIGLFNFRTRKNGVKSGSIKLGYFKTLDTQTYPIPEYVARVARHYDNQFELPMLFLVTCAFGQFLPVNNPMIVIVAWLFVVSRAVHSYYHLGSNHILKRALAFFLGWGCVLVIWSYFLYHHLMLRTF